jgi:lactoylglutathione lyase
MNMVDNQGLPMEGALPFARGNPPSYLRPPIFRGAGTPPSHNPEATLELGAFSVSLAVQDLERSRAFYELLGFRVTGGDPAHGYLILVNGTTVLGLFKGMFEGNILTFNPGWKGPYEEAESFTDVREIAARLGAAGIEFTASELPEGGGPGHVSFLDPDGNPVLIDQHR